MEETEVMVPFKGSIFEARLVYHGRHKVEVTTVKAKGWKRIHRKLAKRDGYPYLWITHIEHDPHANPGGGIVTTTWEM
ncbi:hypothetical protein SEA_FAYELY_80 [Mycobacterium phage Fayely]|nr:hypothetical protein SEA_HORTUMSL17_83 [Mycobacterium phage HortumSL17]AVI04170.1 hypothetical protein SEA_PHONNEGUT_82 [Mycobacterium phage Phonnegut]QGJ88732.1 hypothetical protein SEA_BEEMO_82 [Mycobacterium phage Beemo]UVF60942.1 hypothetical protein SEA_FAYELY_80 [Mycobacterium phage Fayely]